MILALALLCLSAASLFIGVIDLTPSHLITGGAEQLEILLISRLPRLLAILCTGGNERSRADDAAALYE